MANNAATRNNTTMYAALATVLAGCLVALIASDGLANSLRYSLGAVVLVGLAVCAYLISSARRTRKS
jgi:hypothetical protein